MLGIDGRHRLLSELNSRLVDASIGVPHFGCLAAPEEARLCAWLGALDLEGGRAKSALDLLMRASARGDADPTTLTNRAVALEALGRPDEAAVVWAAVAARAGDSALGRRARERRASLLAR